MSHDISVDSQSVFSCPMKRTSAASNASTRLGSSTRMVVNAQPNPAVHFSCSNSRFDSTLSSPSALSDPLIAISVIITSFTLPAYSSWSKSLYARGGTRCVATKTENKMNAAGTKTAGPVFQDGFSLVSFVPSPAFCNVPACAPARASCCDGAP